MVAASCVSASVAADGPDGASARRPPRPPRNAGIARRRVAGRRSARRARTAGTTRARSQRLTMAATSDDRREQPAGDGGRVATGSSRSGPPGSARPTRRTTPIGASSPRAPSRRITARSVRCGPRRAGSPKGTAARREWSRLAAPRTRARDRARRAGRPGSALLYSAGPRSPRAPRRPAPQESSHCPRSAPRSLDAPSGPTHRPRAPSRRRTTGAVYPAGPRRARRGPFFIARAAARGRGGGSAAMPATVIVGLQWGDEGKGKATDFLAEQVRWVVRYQGGDNAGHTIVLGKEVFKLHLVPSGVLYPHIAPLIGPGVVVNPATLIRELDGLAARGIDASRVRVSHAAHVILPVPRGPGPGLGGAPRPRGDRDDEPRDRARLRRPGRPGRRPDGGPPRRRGAPPQARARRPRRERPPRAPRRPRRAVPRRGDPRDGARLGRAPPPDHHRHDHASSRTPCAPATTSSSRERRGRCSTSTTGRTRSSPRPTRSPGAPARAAASARSRSPR